MRTETVPIRLDLQTAARRLGIPVAKVHRLIRGGKLQAVAIDASEVELLANGETKALRDYRRLCR